MQAILKVVGGKNDGREIKITVPEFIIGRGENAHLRPSSDLVSRMHCAIRLKDGRVEVEDLESRNGVFVNDQAITEIHQAKSGDRLRIGRLNFEILIDPIQAGNKKPKVKDVAEAASRVVEQPKQRANEDFDDSIGDWLNEPEDRPLDGSLGNSETVQFSMEEIEALVGQSNSLSKSKPAEDTTDSSSSQTTEGLEDEDDKDDKKKKKKKEFGKLPPLPKFSHDDSISAAGDVLKKFFNRR